MQADQLLQLTPPPTPQLMSRRCGGGVNPCHLLARSSSSYNYYFSLLSTAVVVR